MDPEPDHSGPSPALILMAHQVALECHSISVNLSFLICGLGMIVTALKNAVRRQGTHLAQCKWVSKAASLTAA